MLLATRVNPALLSFFEHQLVAPACSGRSRSREKIPESETQEAIPWGGWMDLQGSNIGRPLFGWVAVTRAKK